MFGKKSKESSNPLATHLLFGIPANIAAGPLGFRAELDINPEGEQPHHQCRTQGRIGLTPLRP